MIVVAGYTPASAGGSCLGDGNALSAQYTRTALICKTLTQMTRRVAGELSPTGEVSRKGAKSLTQSSQRGWDKE